MLAIFETKGLTWTSNIGPSINKIPSDAFTATVDGVTQNLEVINQASKEMGGGLVSTNIPVPNGSRFFGFDVIFDLDPTDVPHYARGENDLKITFAAAGGPQANLSLQWNDDRKCWQLDPTGSTWVDTTYTRAPGAGRNKMQMRGHFDGQKWGVTGLRFNDDPNPYVPDPSKFDNLPALMSGWGPGLHPQLQTEIRRAPWFLREHYERVRIIASDEGTVPYAFD